MEWNQTNDAALIKAIADCPNYAILLIGGHLVVAGKAATAMKDVGADIGGCSGDVGIRVRAAVALRGDERMVAEVWL